jgi:hypothetical protein
MVDSAGGPTTGSAQSFFLRRSSRTMRTLGSPNTPRTVAHGQNAGKRYTSTNRRALPIADSCQVFEPRKTPQGPCRNTFNGYALKIHPHDFKMNLFSPISDLLLLAEISGSAASASALSHVKLRRSEVDESFAK